MIEFAFVHNGPSDLPLKDLPGGTVVPDGNLEAMHQSRQRSVIDQIRCAILTEKLGFHYCFFTEHHFQPEGFEFSPNPILLGAAIAARTKRIRLGQMANILSWWHPIRLAEQAAMLDVISGGRLEFGVGRGQQPRETEIFSHQYGSSSTDEIRSLQYFEEALDVIIKAWTQPSFSHHGEYFHFPPSHIAHHHKQTIEYFSQPGVGRALHEVMDIGEPTMNPVGIYSQATTLKEMQVYPQPLQRPYPQIWQPVIMSSRSMKRAARLGMNTFIIGSSMARVSQDVEAYFQAAEEFNWPDRANRGRFKHGWDSDKKRGVAHVQFVHLTGKASSNPEKVKHALMGRLQYLSDYLPPNGVNAIKLFHDSDEVGGPSFIGGPQQLIDSFMKLKELGRYEDFLCAVDFATSGFNGAEQLEQIQWFGEEVMPELIRACGGAAEHLPTDPKMTF